MIFANQLQTARAAARLTQSQAAARMQRSASTLRKWEQGINTPHQTIQAAVLAALQTKPNQTRKSKV